MADHDIPSDMTASMICVLDQVQRVARLRPERLFYDANKSVGGATPIPRRHLRALNSMTAHPADIGMSVFQMGVRGWRKTVVSS